MDLPGELTSRPGTASDAILSIRRAVTLQASESVEIDIVTGLAATREEALAAIERHRDPRLSWRAFEIAEAHALVEHRAW
jgi:cellobiose phosphorylase